MPRRTSWVRAALKNFQRFPLTVQADMARALDIAAAGEHPESAKPMKGFGAGVLELRERQASGTYRVIYAVQINDDVWVLHAFQKKSKTGIKTPKEDTDLVRQRLRRLKEHLR